MEKYTKSELIESFNFDTEIAMENKKDSNRTKKRQRNNLMVQLLNTMPDDVTYIGSNVPTDRERINAGVLAEMIVKHHMQKNATDKELSLSSCDYDAKQGFLKIEIKLCVNGMCYNTPIKKAMSVILVASDGVYFIKKEEIEEVVNEKGKLPYKEWEGARHIDWLEKKLGYATK